MTRHDYKPRPKKKRDIKSILIMVLVFIVWATCSTLEYREMCREDPECEVTE